MVLKEIMTASLQTQLLRDVKKQNQKEMQDLFLGPSFPYSEDGGRGAQNLADLQSLMIDVIYWQQGYLKKLTNSQDKPKCVKEWAPYKQWVSRIKSHNHKIFLTPRQTSTRAKWRCTWWRRESHCRFEKTFLVNILRENGEIDGKVLHWQDVAHHVLQVTLRRLILQKRANYLVLGTVQFPCGDEYSGYNVLIEGK